MNPPPAVRWLNLFADVPAERVDAELSFWHHVTGAAPGTPTGDRGEFLPLEPDGGDRYVWVQRIDAGSGGWHLDLQVEGVPDATRAAVALGAEVLRRTDGFDALTSPGGLPFCFVAETRPSRRCAPAPTWPDGRRSLVDQICFDIPVDRFDDECGFWSALTGWPRLRGDLAEFDRLQVPGDLPLRILLQRLGDDDAGGIRAHADLSCDDRQAEVARHLSFGATDPDRYEHWTTLRDPAGLRYCVTDRVPKR